MRTRPPRLQLSDTLATGLGWKPHTAVPLDEPVRAPEPAQPPLPERHREHAPERREREKVDG